MALAALIFGKWCPIPAAIACLLFGFTDALQTHLQGVVLWGKVPCLFSLFKFFRICNDFSTCPDS